MKNPCEKPTPFTAIKSDYRTWNGNEYRAKHIRTNQPEDLGEMPVYARAV